MAHDYRPRFVDPEDRRSTFADDAERRPIAARNADPAAFDGVALTHPLAEPPAVCLRLVRLADELVPVRQITGQDLLVDEQHRDTGRTELVLDDVEGLLEIAQEPTHVADHEDVELTGFS